MIALQYLQSCGRKDRNLIASEYRPALGMAQLFVIKTCRVANEGGSRLLQDKITDD